MTAPVRVLVVDDSAFARKVLREVLSTSGRIEVVGFARDGLEALEQIATLAPDVVTLDLVMPNLDGVGVLRHLAGESAPSVVVVSTSDEDSELAIEALSVGAFDYVRKPTNLATERLYELGGELVRKVLAASGARLRRVAAAPSPLPPIAAQASLRATVIVLGTSTGGPQALTRLVPALPPGLPPLVIALHIPAEYTAAMAARLDGLSALDVVEAREGLVLRAGLVVLARGGSDLELERRGDALVARITRHAARPYHPSVDALFESAARACGGAVLGVVLTGMGDDGVAGARSIRAAGGRIVVESASSSVVDGMPRSVREAGLAHADVPLEDVAAEIVRQLGP
jgi:two-component system chemotaxis response regulator CheB